MKSILFILLLTLAANAEDKMEVIATLQSTAPLPGYLPIPQGKPQAGVMLNVKGGTGTHYIATVTFERNGQAETKVMVFANEPRQNGYSVGVVMLATFVTEFTVRSITVEDISLIQSVKAEVQ